MTKTVQKGTVKLTLRNANQVAAFLNNGWTECEEQETPQEAVESLEEVKTVEQEPVKYTKTEVNRMNKETLVAVAMAAGIDDAADKSGTVLKSLLIEHFNL